VADGWQLLEGDCVKVMQALKAESVDVIVCDPPYGLEFMGKDWDRFWKHATGFESEYGPRWSAREPGRIKQVHENSRAYQEWCEMWARECLRVLKPGSHLLAFGGTRTYHRLTCGIEDAGFEIRDCLEWLYGSGFPKSQNISRMIDKRLGAEREKKRVPWTSNVLGGGIGIDRPWKRQAAEDGYREVDDDIPATPEGERWQGWGTALKPVHEPIVMARKPFKGTVAGNVLEYGAGGINVDGCRVGSDARVNARAGNKPGNAARLNNSPDDNDYAGREVEGRWPPNVLVDETVAGELGQRATFFPVFKYHPKASTRERPTAEGVTVHPTVKPLGLMRWLVRLVCPPGGLVLDPFAGTGTTAEAAVLEGMRCVLIERDPDYLTLIDARMGKAMQTELAA